MRDLELLLSLDDDAFQSFSFDSAELGAIEGDLRLSQSEPLPETERPATKRTSEKSRVAQKKYRDRKRAKEEQQARRIDELQDLVHRLSMEKDTLLSRCEMLEKVSKINEEHLSVIRTVPVVSDKEQESVLEAAAAVAGEYVEGSPIPLAEARCWTLRDLAALRQRGLQRQLNWLLAGASEEGSPARQRLEAFILARRRVNLRIAVANPRVIQGIFAFEAAEARGQPPSSRPSALLWQRILTAMQLSQSQVDAVLRARARLLCRLGLIFADRTPLLDAQEGTGIALAAKAAELEASLQREREACRDFLMTFFDETLTPLQEAKCDVQAYPWCPQALAMANILAGQAAVANEAAGDAATCTAPEPPDCREAARRLGVPWPAATPYAVLGQSLTTHTYILTLRRALFMHASGAVPLAVAPRSRDDFLDMSVLAFGRLT